MHPGLIFLIVLFTIIGIAAIVILVLYKLHIKGIIEVRIPKRARVLCFKHYLSPEEKEAIRAEHEY